jgi:hypothetical protein
MIGPHEPDDEIECCQDGCQEADDCGGCGACVCEPCNPESAHYNGCDQACGVSTASDYLEQTR